MTAADPAAVPAELHDRARAVLDPVHYDYFAGGAGQERVLADNLAAFDRLNLLPRVLTGSAAPDLTTELPGAHASLPVLVAPTAFHRLAHPDGELATARATAEAGTVLMTGMAATVAVAEVAAAARAVDQAAAIWFQLFPQSDPAVTDCLVERATDAGCAALVVTVDSPVFGRHVRDLRNGFSELPAGLAAENMRELPGAPAGGSRDIEMVPLSWQAVERLRASTSLPIYLKGILHPADSRIAIGHGIDGIIVSNHGGRQLDAVPASIDALPAVLAAVRGEVPVLLDGGIRRGSDVAIALALGAAAVGIGRPVLWGLATDGRRGVSQVLELLRDELGHVLTLCGASRPADLSSDQVVHRDGSGRARS